MRETARGNSLGQNLLLRRKTNPQKENTLYASAVPRQFQEQEDGAN